MVMPDSARPPTVAIVTLGCGRNEVDSANIAGMLSASGFEMVEDPGAADAVLVNTCAFITAAKQESIDTILAAVDLKSPPSDHKLTSDVSAQAAKRESIDTILAAADLKEQGRASAVFVTGCLAERYTRELRQELPEADAIVPFADYSRLPELLRSRLPNGSALGPKAGAATALASPRRAARGAATAALGAASPAPAAAPPDRGEPPAPPASRALPLVSPGGASAPLVPAGRRALPLVFPAPAGERFAARPGPTGPVALVKLAEGCDRDCSFCAIPSFRGRFRSRRPTEVLDEVAWLASHGVSEVGLVAENSTSYGKDLGGRELLIRLLRELAGVDGLRRVRLNYLQPDAPRGLHRRLPPADRADPIAGPRRGLPLQLHPGVPRRAAGGRPRARSVPRSGPPGLGRLLPVFGRGRHRRPRLRSARGLPHGPRPRGAGPGAAGARAGRGAGRLDRPQAPGAGRARRRGRHRRGPQLPGRRRLGRDRSDRAGRSQAGRLR